MALIDADGRSSTALPSISYLDVGKLKKEEAEYQQRYSATAPLNITAAAMADPTSPYSVPPPPYTYPTSIANTGPPLPSLLAPTESRRIAVEDQEPQQARQSLPSIHEALGKEQNLSYAVQPPSSAPATQAYHRDSMASPSLSARGAYRYDQPWNTPSHPRAQHTSHSPYIGHSSRGPPSAQPQQHYPETLMRPPYQGPPTSHPSSTHNRLPQSPGRQVRQHVHSSYPPAHSHALEHPASLSGSMHPPYGYPTYASHGAYPAPPPPPPSAPAYRSSIYTGPGRYIPTWRSDGNEASRAEESKRAGRADIPGYGESVKRHLDTFELEASLNEVCISVAVNKPLLTSLMIADSSGQVLEFARHYGQQAHQRQRSGLVSGTMPNLVEIDTMIKQGSRIQEAFARMREVVITQQAALAERAQDYNKKAAVDHDADDSVSQDDGKGGGFSGADPKKRRGRAAPPGRCHSCNRAETPEWRRGPDGARTLCNACGLHYAKITRKMGSKPATGGSNLRPKSTGPGSPT